MIAPRTRVLISVMIFSIVLSMPLILSSRSPLEFTDQFAVQGGQQPPNATASGDVDNFSITLPANSFIATLDRTGPDIITANLHTGVPLTLPAGETKDFAIPEDPVCGVRVTTFAAPIPEQVGFGPGQERFQLAAQGTRPVGGRNATGWGAVMVIVVKVETGVLNTFTVQHVVEAFFQGIENRQPRPLSGYIPPKVRNQHQDAPGFDLATEMSRATWVELGRGLVIVDTPHIHTNAAGAIANQPIARAAGLRIEDVNLINGEHYVITRQFRAFVRGNCNSVSRLFLEVFWTATSTISFSTVQANITGKGAVSVDAIIDNPTATPEEATSGRIIPTTLSMINDFTGLQSVP